LIDFKEDFSTLADSTEAWKMLEENLTELVIPESNMHAFRTRKAQALTSAQVLTTLQTTFTLDILEEGCQLKKQGMAMKFAEKKNQACASLLPMVLKFRAQASPFIHIDFI
jgi:hypothetical protein